MSGLERLRELARNYMYRSKEYESLNEIANEIEEDINRWYLPRPVIDGEPVQFGDDLVFLEDDSHLRISSISMNENGDYYLNGYKVSKFSREPDSIENLRDEIYDVVSDVYAIGVHEIVDEWLKRAEKLFKDGGE